MIREIVITDEKQVYQLICELEQSSFDLFDFHKRFSKWVENEKCFMYGYFHGTELVGFISLMIKELLHHKFKTGEIVELIVRDKESRKGIGKQLIQVITQKAKKLQLEELELCTNIKRTSAHRFYIREGFIMDHYNFIKKL